MSDRVDLYVPAHAAEANAIAAHLRENGVDCEVHSFRDSAYGPLFQGQHGWGALRVPVADEEKARKLLEEWLSAEPGAAPPPTPEPAPTPARSGNPLTFLALLVSLIANAYFLVAGGPRVRPPPPVVETFDGAGRLNARFLYNDGPLPHTILRFDTSGRLYSQDFDADLNGRSDRWAVVGAGGVPLSESFDDNQDGMPEREVRYDGAGRKATEWFDANADRAFEKAIDYAPVGAPWVEYSDDNADHRFERMVILRRGQGRAEAVDADADGIFERMRVLDFSGTLVATLDDQDQDGVAESVTCPGSTRVWNVLRCGR